MDDEIAGTGNSYTAPYWQYDPRIGRRWNQDPVNYPWQSAYATFNNNPIFFKDPLGLEGEGSNGGGGCEDCGEMDYQGGTGAKGDPLVTKEVPVSPDEGGSNGVSFSDISTSDWFRKGMNKLLGQDHPFRIDDNELTIGDYDPDDFTDLENRVIDRVKYLNENADVEISAIGYEENIPIYEEREDKKSKSLKELPEHPYGANITFDGTRYVYVAEDPTYEIIEPHPHVPGGTRRVTKSYDVEIAVTWTMIHEVVGHAYQGEKNPDESRFMHNNNVEKFMEELHKIFNTPFLKNSEFWERVPVDH